MGAEVVPVFHDEEAVYGGSDLFDGGEHAVGEDVPVDPGVGAVDGAVAADAVEQGDAVVGHEAAYCFHVLSVVAVADVFKHADGVDAVECLGDVPVVLEADFDGEVPAELGGVVVLFFGDGDADDGALVFFCDVLGGAAPAAPYVQDAHVWLELEFAADEVYFGFLGFIQGVGGFPVAAAVGHSGIEHGAVQVVSDVVVAFADDPRPGFVLHVEQECADEVPGEDFCNDGAVEAGLEQFGHHLVQPLAVPPVVHVALAQSQGALG